MDYISTQLNKVYDKKAVFVNRCYILYVSYQSLTSDEMNEVFLNSYFVDLTYSDSCFGCFGFLQYKNEENIIKSCAYQRHNDKYFANKTEKKYYHYIHSFVWGFFA